MAGGNTFQDAVLTASHCPGLGVGCHVVLVDGNPSAPPDNVPSLLTPQGTLRSSLANFVFDLQRGRIHEDHIEIEAEAQIRRLQQAGINVSHVDTHKHTHLFPRVARPLMRAAKRCGVAAIRNPFEPSWSARLTRGAMIRKLEVAALRNFSSTFRKLLRASGLRSTDGSIGVSATGNLDAANLQRLLRDMPSGTWELVCHPGYNDTELNQIRTRLRDTRDVERKALSNLIAEAASSNRIQLLTFHDI